MAANLPNADYIKFILKKTGNDLLSFPGLDIVTVNKLFLRLTSANDILKDIYLISQVKKLQPFGNYLLFVYEKVINGEINFDNLSQNINVDAEYLKNEILKSVDYIDPERVHEKGPDEHTLARPGATEKLTGREIIIQNKFKVEEIENDLVTEEFTETDLAEDAPMTEKSSIMYLELIKNEDDKKEEAFDMPEANKEEETPAETQKKPFIDAEGLSIRLNGPAKKNETEEIPAGEIKEPAEESLIFDSDDIEVYDDMLSEEEEMEVMDEVMSKMEVRKVHDDFSPKTNKAYLEYEESLFLINAELKEAFDIFKDAGYEPRMASELIDKSFFMEDYSRRMSFEIITGVYETINKYFKKAKEGKHHINDTEIDILARGLKLIESLIKDEDYLDHDEVISKFEDLKKEIAKEPEQTDETVKAAMHTEEPVFVLKERYSNSAQRENYQQLKHKIQELEKSFSELDSIKGYYKNYEGLRRLSGTFRIFKELVRLSKMLDLTKLAQLSESSYIFIKFLQNYRLDPFDNEVKEILRYIIYNFKLIALDKPTKDLDVFVSYLNDPVKIFTQNKKN